MHPELVKLLDLQSKDVTLAEIDVALAEVAAEVNQLDGATAAARAAIEAARRAEAEGDRRHGESSAKLDTFRAQQDRRRQQLDQVTRPRDAAAVMAEIELARSVIANEEAQLLKLANERNRLADAVKEAESRLSELEAEQVEQREALAEKERGLQADRERAQEAREASAAQVEKAARHRYNRLRQSRSGPVVVQLSAGACGACFTSVPLSRRTQIQQGLVLDGCESCGVILYVPENGT